MKFEKALSFDDIMMVPSETDLQREDIDTSNSITDDIELEVPILSSPMDKVTGGEMAIAMAREGGMGVIHRNLDINSQIEMVKKVKRSENWIIRDPYTVSPDIKARKAKGIMDEKDISGLPVIKEGKLIGIVTKRDLRFETELDKKVKEVMTSELVTADPYTDMNEAKSILNENKIEKLPLVDEEDRLKGLITVRDIEKKKQHPHATMDENGQLMVASAAGPDEFERIEPLVDAGVDMIVVDTAHGNSKDVIQATEEINGSFDVDIMAGNIATGEGARSLIEAGADSLRVGIGPGSICTTRIVSGIGVPQVTAIRNVYEEAQKEDIGVIADGGIRYSGDAAKALASGADAVMLGNMLAGTEEAPGRVVFRGGRKYKEYRGMASISALEQREKNRYDQDFERREEYVPEGVEGLVPYKGTVSEVLHQIVGGIKSSMGHLGAETIDKMREAEIYEITEGGKQESHPHNVEITEDTPNYHWRGER
ncbi:MAG: IMP dehydrogenase [Candidatus Thermoplasmatota archaeon]|nr:IMP dehydrogenase [Candidatus Thermoplasmatota archaeon]